MTIHDLAAQYRADGKARVFVEAVWVAPRYQHTGSWGYIYLSQWDHTEEAPYPENRHWAAAADFTLQRIEEIRLSEEDTLLIFTKMAACYLRRKESYQRILFREHAHLDSLTKGMKPEVLE